MPIFADLFAIKSVDQALYDFSTGKQDFECPDIDPQLTSSNYQHNDIEKEFLKKSKIEIWRKVIGCSIVGYVAGLYAAKRLGQAPGVKTFATLSGFMFGSSLGGVNASLSTMQQQINLQNSPIAMETRYQLWKHNPNHRWLNNHQNDVKRWNSMEYRYDTNEIVSTQKRQTFYENRKKLGQNQQYQTEVDVFDNEKQNKCADTKHSDMKWG
eukprot:542340_1